MNYLQIEVSKLFHYCKLQLRVKDFVKLLALKLISRDIDQSSAILLQKKY